MQHLMMVVTDYTCVLTVFTANLLIEYSVKEIRKCINFVKKKPQKKTPLYRDLHVTEIIILKGFQVNIM